MGLRTSEIPNSYTGTLDETAWNVLSEQQRCVAQVLSGHREDEPLSVEQLAQETNFSQEAIESLLPYLILLGIVQEEILDDESGALGYVLGTRFWTFLLHGVG